ncbi:MAG: T9SS type A sorting domain-containing protein, partial [Bacteroidota bacterium]|nr:T9SS type A sorting domain-containing protein [Bacteroidota bacterium]
TTFNNYNSINESIQHTQTISTICPTHAGNGYLFGGWIDNYQGLARKSIVLTDENGFIKPNSFVGSGFEMMPDEYDNENVTCIVQAQNGGYYVAGNFNYFNGLYVDPLVRILEDLSSIKDGMDEIVFNFYPNPANNFLNIRIAEGIIKSIEIYNQTGQLLRKINSNNSREQVDISALPPGNYFIRAISRDDVFVREFVVLR